MSKTLKIVGIALIVIASLAVASSVYITQCEIRQLKDAQSIDRQQMWRQDADLLSELWRVNNIINNRLNVLEAKTMNFSVPSEGWFFITGGALYNVFPNGTMIVRLFDYKDVNGTIVATPIENATYICYYYPNGTITFTPYNMATQRED